VKQKTNAPIKAKKQRSKIVICTFTGASIEENPGRRTGVSEAMKWMCCSKWQLTLLPAYTQPARLRKSLSSDGLI